ncbi:MAG: SGNH/GDSL hydrolase family protein [Synechococcaceae cyanobacterium]|nr:SGNH/GDSL hydrolase family protein [Synechococcaceae cyanobacterium]
MPLRPRLRVMAAAAALVSALLPSAALAGVTSLSHLFVFGDSLSDSGNAGVISGGTFTPAPYAGNRATNGPVAVEQLWQQFNPGDTSFKPSLLGGSNFAILGATSGKENNLETSSNLPPILQAAYANKGNAWQLQNFISANPSFEAQTSLFVVWLFPNDVFYFRGTGYGNSAGTYDGSDGTATSFNAIDDLAVSNVLGTINTLASRGARHFLVVNSPDLGLTPAFRGTAAAADMTAISSDFNSKLETDLSTFTSANPLLDIELFQLDDVLNQLISSPTTYGLTNVTDPCLTSISVCSNPSQYLFWDTLHPTTAGHALIAQRLYSTVVETPSPLPLLGFSAAMGWSRRLRQRLKVG